MEQEYQISKPIKVMFCVVLTGMFLYSIYLSSLSWGKGSISSIIIPLLMSIACILVIINQIKSKITISDTNIIKVNLFSKRELELKNIKGFRIDYRTIVIEPIEQKYPRLVVRDYVRTDGNQLLSQWLEKNLKDLDKK